MTYYTELEVLELTAIIHPVNLRIRDNKILLTTVYNIDGKMFRDHSWIKFSNSMRKLVGKRKTKFKVKFTASTFNYMSSEGDKVGLMKIRGMKFA